ncbi:MAG: hypothetical protein OEY14_02895, partial [Myxococcales bacterium]|nr:hypothetical protein [Myxococcales bacterium]
MSFRVAGFNLGKASLGLALGRVDEQGRFEFEWARSLTHEGNPFAAFSGLYAEHEIGECALVAATGTYAGELREPVLVLPEDACQQAALELDPEAPPILNLVSIGGRGYSALSRRPEPGAGGAYAYRFVESDKCSSGTGENILKLTGRFGLDLEEADAMARAAEKSIPITARCSVFAKSEMTHYANEGRPKDELLRGYFGSVARNVRSLLARVEIDGAIYLVGGAARLETLREALEELVGRSVHRPQHFECFEAVGAVALAAEELLRAGARAYEESGVPLVQTRQKRFQTLPAARRYAGQVTMMPEPSAPSTLPDEPVVLGLDLGSTGAKAVLTSVATGEPLFDVYDRTRGNPIEASQRLVRAILESGVPDVRAIALTGSGRQAVATLLGGVFPDR